MSNRLSESEREELDLQYRASSSILAFLSERGYFDPEVIADGQSGLDDAYEREDVRALRMARRDLDALTGDLTSDERPQLEAMMERQLGRSLQPHRVQEEEQIAAVLKRGKILTDEEYYLVSSRLEEVAAYPQKLAEARLLDRLVTAYGKRS